MFPKASSCARHVKRSAGGGCRCELCSNDGMLLLIKTTLQVEKSKCKLLDLEAQQSDDHDTSEGGDSYGLQTQVQPTCNCARDV